MREWCWRHDGDTFGDGNIGVGVRVVTVIVPTGVGVKVVTVLAQPANPLPRD